MKHFALLLSLALLSPLTVSMAHADPGHHGHGMGKGHGHGEFRHILQQLDLSDDQKAQLKKARQDVGTQMKNLRSQMKDLRKQMFDAMKTNADDAKLTSYHNQIKEVHSKLADMRFQKMIAVRKILNDSQRAKYFELMSQRRGHHKGW